MSKRTTLRLPKGDLVTRMFCDECAALRIRACRMYCLCPNGHGRLWPAFPLSAATAYRREHFLDPMPVATRLRKRVSGRRTYQIEGVEGRYGLARPGSPKAEPGRKLATDEVNAKVFCGDGVVMGRVFRLIEPTKARQLWTNNDSTH